MNEFTKILISKRADGFIAYVIEPRNTKIRSWHKTFSAAAKAANNQQKPYAEVRMA